MMKVFASCAMLASLVFQVRMCVPLENIDGSCGSSIVYLVSPVCTRWLETIHL